MRKVIILTLAFPFLAGCGLVPIPHTLKMPTEEIVVLRDKTTGLYIDHATVSYTLNKWENWIKPLEFYWGVFENCSNNENNASQNDEDSWQAQDQGYGLYHFSQKTKIGWSKFWGIGPLGSWLYDTYCGSYTICAPGYHGIYFSDGLHSGTIHINEYLSFEGNRIIVYLVPLAEDIPTGHKAFRDK